MPPWSEFTVHIFMAILADLSYGDVYLHKEDIRLLTGPHWLNDNVRHMALGNAACHESGG